MKNCPNCNAQVKDAAKFCGKCGFNILKYESEQTNTKRFCTECGAEVEPDERFCPECGHPMDEDTPAEICNRDFDIDEITALAEQLMTEKQAEERAKAAASTEYQENLTKARVACIRGKYEQAQQIYEEMLEKDPADMNGYMGLIRIATKNYSVFVGEEIDDSIRVAKQICREKNIGKYDPDYADYVSRKEEAGRKAEAERKAKEEAERKAKEIAANFDIQDGCLSEYKGKGGAVVIPDSVTSIGESAFEDCDSLTSVTIPASVTSIGESAFEDCDSLTSVTIPASVTSIGDRAFYGCSSLTSVTIPDSVTSIGEDAFYNCSGLTSVTIPNSVTSIGQGAFFDCSDLESIVVDKGNEVFHSTNHCLIETTAKTLIAGCKNSVIPTDGSVTRIGEKAFSYCDSLTSVTIPASVTSIGDDAFYGCSSLTSVTIPDSVTSIGWGVFSGFSGLESIVVDKGNEVFHSTNHCLIETTAKTLIAGCKNSVIPTDGSVTSIGGGAFGYCSLTSVTIPDGVTWIGDCAFSWCSSLRSVTIPDSVTHIGKDAFYMCSRLTSVTIPRDCDIETGLFSSFPSGCTVKRR